MARPLRYGFILAAVAFSAALAAVGGWRYARASSPVNGPIILISVDSLRADRLPVYGYHGAQTPAIDELAADSIVFDHAYSHSAETLPSHVAMLSGRLPSDTGVRDDVGFTVKENERLLAKLLRDRGYATAGIVSTFALRQETGIGQGFTLFDDKMSPAPPDRAIGGVVRDGADAERAAEQWLDSSGTSRAFLFLQISEADGPYDASSQSAGASPYDAAVEHADEIVGSLLKYLKAHQLYDRSTILLTSDHGQGLGAHGEQGHGLFVYEESLHVPLLVKQAAGEGAGRRVGDLVEHVDIVPTVLDLAKAPNPGGLRGQSLKPLLDGTGHLTGRTAYAESLFGRYHFGWHDLASLTDGRYHYIRALGEELYDLRSDRGEHHNLADAPSSAATLARFRAELGRMQLEPAPHQADVSTGDRERLDVLGDVGRVLGDPYDDPADPKDTYGILTTYREAVQLANRREWAAAVERLQTIVRTNPELADAWRAIGAVASTAERYQLAAEAYKRAANLAPDSAVPQLGAADALTRLRRFDEARQHAAQALELAGEKDIVSRASAYEWLARIAIAKADPDTAREEAALAQKVEPKRPLALFVDARLLHDQERYEEAAPLFEKAVGLEQSAHTRPILDLHYYFADTLIHLQRGGEAEDELSAELSVFPQNTRARAALATLLHGAGRDEETAAVMADLVRVSPTADTYALAARLWTSFGSRREAAEARAAATRLSAAAISPAH